MDFDFAPHSIRTAESPFDRTHFGGKFRSTRTRRPGEVNLKSCGLLHPKAAEFHAATLRSIDPIEVLTYPVYGETYALAAAYLGATATMLVLTPGSDPGLGLLVRAFPEAKRIVLHTPNFEGWSKFAMIAGRTLDPVAPAAKTGKFQITDLIDRLHEGPPGFVVLNQPHGHTGQVHSADEIAELADRVGRHGSLLVLDTAYLAFTAGGEDLIRGVVGLPQVVRVNSFSKSHGLSGASVAAVSLSPDRAANLFDLDPEGPLCGVSLTLLRAALAEPELFAMVHTEVRRWRAVLATLVESALAGVPGPAAATSSPSMLPVPQRRPAHMLICTPTASSPVICPGCRGLRPPCGSALAMKPPHTGSSTCLPRGGGHLDEVGDRHPHHRHSGVAQRA